jgi:hypothetical protein
MSETKALEEYLSNRKHGTYCQMSDEMECTCGYDQARRELAELNFEIIERRNGFELMTDRLIAEEAKTRQLRAELDEARKVIKSALVEMEKPDEVDAWTAKAFRMLAAFVAPKETK